MCGSINTEMEIFKERWTNIIKNSFRDLSSQKIKSWPKYAGSYLWLNVLVLNKNSFIELFTAISFEYNISLAFGLLSLKRSPINSVEFVIRLWMTNGSIIIISIDIARNDLDWWIGWQRLLEVLNASIRKQRRYARDTVIRWATSAKWQSDLRVGWQCANGASQYVLLCFLFSVSISLFVVFRFVIY